MAKNKNRKGGSQNRTARPEQAQEHVQRSASESHDSPVSHIQGSPSDVARKKQQRFGHN
ncbi:hypothetical protein ACF073_30630 [Streptomyces sp. NPDC015171]|uniref:hypothetical protein n=1 Tax=Streptomyces sp. NPDC015171 TaxID=3364945 RepID=UPI0036FA8093